MSTLCNYNTPCTCQGKDGKRPPVGRSKAEGLLRDTQSYEAETEAWWYIQRERMNLTWKFVIRVNYRRSLLLPGFKMLCWPRHAWSNRNNRTVMEISTASFSGQCFCSDVSQHNPGWCFNDDRNSKWFAYWDSLVAGWVLMLMLFLNLVWDSVIEDRHSESVRPTPKRIPCASIMIPIMRQRMWKIYRASSSRLLDSMIMATNVDSEMISFWFWCDLLWSSAHARSLPQRLAYKVDK